MKRIIFAARCASLAVASVACLAQASAQGIVKKEPGEGVLWQGEIVFVDDGTCPAGQIKLVIGGERPRNEIVLDNAQRNVVRCIKRPPPA